MEKQNNSIDLPPEPSILIESLRGIGYSLQAAIADIVDNSIAAEARNIDIVFEKENSRLSYISILDDGRGMTDEQLLLAMKLGSTNPLTQRRKIDLGRFGMGLKTASFSQCRCLTVISKTFGGKASTKRWDLDYLSSEANNGRWSLLVEPGPEASKLSSLLDSMDHGTLIVWEKTDRIEIPAGDAYFDLLEVVEDHLGLTFHKLLEQNPTLNITLNGARINPLNPFLPNQTSTLELQEERFYESNGNVIVRGYVLPNKENISSRKLYEKAGGRGGWASNEGFYIYRNKRLIQAGGWLGTGRLHEQLN